MKKRKLNEAEYNLTITDLNTTDGDTLSQIVAMANQADNGGMADMEAPAPVDPYEDGMVGDTAIDTPFDTMGSDDMDMENLPAEAPVEEPMVDDMGVEDDFAPAGEDLGVDDFEPEMEENNFNEEEPYTHPCAHAESGNLLTEDEGKIGYSVMVKDKEYARIDTDKEYSDDEIINQFLKQYMEKTGKEFPYTDQIVVKRNGVGVEEDVLLPKDDDNEFIPEEENWMMEDDEESPLTDDQINEEINSIMWSAGCKGCSDKEEKGVKKDSLLEDDRFYQAIEAVKSDWANEENNEDKLFDICVDNAELFGIDPERLMNAVLNNDKEVDEAKSTWKPSDENSKVNAMAYLDDDVKQVYDLFQTGDYTPTEVFDMLKDAGVEYKRAREILQQWVSEKYMNESENPEMNLKDCDAPNPAEMNLDDKEQVDESSAAERAQIGARPENNSTKKYKIYQNWGGEIFVTDHNLNNNYDLMDDSDSFDEIEEKMTNDWENANWFIYDSNLFNNPNEEIKNSQIYFMWSNDESEDLNGHVIDLSSDYAEINESAYSPKLKDPNRKKPTQANYQDVNINADAKSGTLGFEYPAPTSGKISLSPKAGKIMETAKHLISNADGNKKEKLQSRFVFKLMNEGVSYSDAKKIVSRF